MQNPPQTSDNDPLNPRTPNIGWSQRCRPIFYRLHFPWINFNSLTRDDMTNKCHRPRPKLTFAILSKQLIFFKYLQHHTQMVYMIIHIFQIYQDVVNEDNEK